MKPFAYTWRTPRGAASTCQPRPRLMNGSHSPVREARDRGPNITCKKGWPVIQVLKAIEVPGNRRCPLRERGVRTHDQRLFARIETRGARGARHVHLLDGTRRALRCAVVAREFVLLEGLPHSSRLPFRGLALKPVERLKLFGCPGNNLGHVPGCELIHNHLVIPGGCKRRAASTCQLQPHDLERGHSPLR